MVAIAIDLGTTYTCVAVWRNGTVEVIANDQGNRTTPSYVAFTAMERLIGEPAKTQAPQNPRNTVYAVKRLIGRRYDDISIQLDLPFWPFQVIDENGKPKILVEYKGKKKTLTPEEISAMLLCRMKEVAEAYLGTKVEDAVITVPAYFNDAQRQATRIAGTIAGLKVLRIINEPTAAALAYGLDCNLKGDKNLLIYDLGGGTLDVSVLTIGDGSVYEVKATAGNSRLGGEDFDNRLVVFLAEDFKNKFGIDILRNSKSLRRLKTAAERTKRFLTSVTEAPVEVESLYTDIDYCGKVSRALFEDLCSDLFKDTLIPIERALKDAKMKKEDIHNVILIGGSTRIPKIQSMLQEYFKKPLTTSINPDEAVAYGAAIQAAILSGEHHKKIQDVLLVDVVPLSLGIETVRGLMLKVIERNTPIPCQQTKELTTLEDYQTAMTIEIFEGERTLTKDNNLLGRFDLKDIPPAPRGVPKIYVTFNVDSNGILSVSAQDQATGNTEGITINNDQRLNQKDILVMMADADRFKEEDNENKRRLEARNQLETYVYNTKNIIRENSNKITEEEKTFLQNECEEALNWLESNVNNVREEYEVKISELMRRWSKVLAKFCDLRHRVKRQKSEAQQAETSGQAQAIIQELEAIEDELGKNLDNK